MVSLLFITKKNAKLTENKKSFDIFVFLLPSELLLVIFCLCLDYKFLMASTKCLFSLKTPYREAQLEAELSIINN